MNAPATAAQAAPNAVPNNAKQPAWLDMNEEEFTALCKKNGWAGKRLAAMKERRAEYAAADDAVAEAAISVTDPALAEQPEAKANAGSWPTAPKRTRMQVIQAAIALDKAPPDALRTRFIDPKLIDVKEGWNARVDFGDLEELGASILNQKRIDGHGLVNDIRVKEKADGRYELVDGERRYQTVMGLMDRGEVWDFGIPAKVEPADSTDAELIIKMFTANAGKAFLPYEEALYFKRLRDSGLTLAQIEEKTGRSDNSIVGALALLEADDDLVDAVLKGSIGATMAKSIAVNARGDKARQRELTTAAKAAGKDKKALKVVKKAVDDSRRSKAAKKGLTLKMRALDDSELAQLGTNIGLQLKALMDAAGMAHDSDMTAWVNGDRELAMAASFGALQALKAAAGVKTALDFGADS